MNGLDEPMAPQNFLYGESTTLFYVWLEVVLYSVFSCFLALATDTLHVAGLAARAFFQTKTVDLFVFKTFKMSCVVSCYESWQEVE